MAGMSGRNINIWGYKRKKELYDEIVDKTYRYFDDLYVEDTEGKEFILENGLVYREGQHNFALDVVEAIKNNKILLIQAGVGIGKSYGYLIPIFYTFDGVKSEKNIRFDKIVISTSNIALQHQLIRDIEKISEMIDIPIKAVIAKGINNYACIKRIEKAINSSYTFDNKREQLKVILDRIYEYGSSDKSDLSDISESVWRSIQLCSRGFCSNCAYSRNCSFYKTEESIKDSNIIITNHANYINNILKWDIDALIVDEAHKFDENLINVLKGEIKLINVFYNIDKVYNFIDRNIYGDEINLNDYFNYLNSVKEKFRYLFAYIKRSAISSFNKNNHNNNSVTDGDRMSFNFNPDIIVNIKVVKREIEFILNMMNKIEGVDKYQKNEKYSILNYFLGLNDLLDDMLSREERKNIYWVSFFDEEGINLGYVPKDRTFATKKIFEKEIPIVFTSATLLDDNSSYSYFANKIGLDKVCRSVEYAEEQLSPYDYEHNALFYYDKDVAVPNEHDNNVLDLALKIGELIRITNGKSLVLFTSKKRMEEVYNLMMKDDFPFRVLLQNDSNVDMIREEFEQDVDACLFATGSFWEGISFKGKTLSNLIITHLPFDNVDAINKYEAGKYANRYEKLKYVYIPDMLIKMKQAIGRLIRSDSDTGIVCCLDSRMENYLEQIRNISPIKNITSNIKEVYEFSDKKINNTSSNSLIKTK